MRGANPGDVWELSHVYYCQKNRQKHPTQKPEGLVERMILASSNEGSTVLDPFSGSGTVLRVCRQLNCNAIGIEINPSYVEQTKLRLNDTFEAFDGLDPRTERVPLDLRKAEIRDPYIQNHTEWLLKHHSDKVAKFMSAVSNIYPSKAKERKQKSLFEDS